MSSALRLVAWAIIHFWTENTQFAVTIVCFLTLIIFCKDNYCEECKGIAAKCAFNWVFLACLNIFRSDSLSRLARRRDLEWNSDWNISDVKHIFSSMTSRVLYAGSHSQRGSTDICYCDVVFICLWRVIACVEEERENGDGYQQKVKTIKSCFKLSCHGRNQFYNYMPVTTDEHSYFGQISHSTSLVTDLAKIQLMFVGSNRLTVTESLFHIYYSNSYHCICNWKFCQIPVDANFQLNQLAEQPI